MKMRYLNLSLVLSLLSLVANAEEYHIGIATGTVSQSEDDLRGAEQVIKEYGDAAKGGLIKHVTYPDNFTSEAETTISQIAGLADDAKMKAIIVNQGVPGTAEAFKRIKAKRKDILLLVAEPAEDPAIITSIADVSVQSDVISRGFLIINSAKQIEAKSFVHISFPRHMSYEILSRRRAIMREASKDLGIKFHDETAPDPTSDVGVAGAQQFILQKVPTWIKKYGKDTAFFCTNDAHTDPLIKQTLAGGAMFVEADLPSPTMGYPGALGVDLKSAKGNFQEIMKLIEIDIIKKGGKGRFGTWSYSLGYTNSIALVEYAKRIIENKAKKGEIKDLTDSYAKYTPNSKWNANMYLDPKKNEKSKNFYMIYQDTYIFGKGYLNATSVQVPEKYFKIVK